MSSEARQVLRQRMADKGLNQSGLAGMLDRKPSTVCRWLDEEKPSIPDATSLVALEVALGIPIALWLSPEQREGIAALRPVSEPPASDRPASGSKTGTDG